MIHLGAGCAVTEIATGAAWGGERLCAEIACRAGRLAARGIGRGDRVIIAHGGTAAFIADLFAVWRRGACAACANPAVTKPELATLVDLVHPAAVILATAPEGARLPGGVPALCLDSGEAAATDPVSSEPGDPALILFTSGSTGVPKAVAHSFAGLSARIALNRKHIDDAVLARSLCVLPTHFGHGLIGNCLTPLAAGGALHLAAGNSIRTAAGLGAAIDANRITFMSSVPSFWRLVLKMSRPPLTGTLKRLHVGSAPLSTELWQAIIDWSGCKDVVNMYGLTETANWVAGASAREFAPADGLVGRMWGGEAAVLGADGRMGEVGDGEILLRTPSMMLGYDGRAQLTAEALHEGWLVTGDVGSIDANGVIRLTGRTRTEINRAGIKVHPEEVELMLERHPDVAEACAFAVPDPVAGEIVGAAVTAVEGAELGKTTLADWCAGQIRREAVPDRWFFLPAIPKNDRGKLDRRAVRSACLEKEQRQ